LTVLPVAESPSNTGEATVRHVRDAIASAAPTAEVGGTGAGMVDQLHAFYGNFVLILAALALVTFLLLARAFRSVLLAAKAVLLNLVSVAAAYGVMVLVWQQGHGSHLIWGVPATGAIPAWIPLMVFAFLFGLSMDYEVFILTRMREEYEATGSTTRAVVTGIGRTGRLVTSAALILFLALAALASAPLVDLKVFASALAAGILLDATIVRALLVPALVSLFGRWNWWLPGWLAWLLRVPAAPLPARGERRANGGDGDGHDDQNGASAAPLAGASAG
jgi:RND superfamily putative drug exporter